MSDRQIGNMLDSIEQYVESNEDISTSDEYMNSPMGRHMNSPVAQTNDKIAVLFTFPRGVSKEEVEQAIEPVMRSHTIESMTLREYDPELGGEPVIYFP